MPALALFLAASAMPFAQPAKLHDRPAQFRPISGITGEARVTVRIVHGVRWGRDHQDHGRHLGQRRDTKLAAADGKLVPAQLLEFE